MTRGGASLAAAARLQRDRRQFPPLDRSCRFSRSPDGRSASPIHNTPRHNTPRHNTRRRNTPCHTRRRNIRANMREVCSTRSGWEHSGPTDWDGGPSRSRLLPGRCSLLADLPSSGRPERRSPRWPRQPDRQRQPDLKLRCACEDPHSNCMLSPANEPELGKIPARRKLGLRLYSMTGMRVRAAAPRFRQRGARPDYGATGVSTRC